jgi:eukaryotic-like serine/threonine-protein kinase
LQRTDRTCRFPKISRAGQDNRVETVAGYRLVRKLGFGTRAAVFLGHAGTADSGAVAAIKIFGSGTPGESIDAEIEALSRVTSRHLVTLRDVSWDRNRRPCLVLDRVGPRNLAHLLIERGGIEPGEAVTILAPLVESVAQLHREGVAHGALRLSNVLFDDAGAPVLIGFGGAVLLGPASGGDAHSLTPAQLTGSEAVTADVADLALLCRSVLEGTRDVRSLPTAGALYDCLDSAASTLDADLFPRELAERLYDLAEPIAVRVTPLPVPSLRHPTGLVLPLQAVVSQPAVDAPAGARGALRHTVRRLLSSVRRPVWFAAAIAAALLIASLVAIPPSTAPGASDVSPETSTSEARVVVPAAVRGQDPAKAVLALLDVRAECLRKASASCLQSVDQDGSATLENDKRLISSGRPAGAEDLLDPVEKATLVQRLGDSALISVQFAGGATAIPLLAIRTEHGWRIRDLLVG